MKTQEQIQKEADKFCNEHLIFHIEKLNMFPVSGTQGKLLSKIKMIGDLVDFSKK